MTELRDKASRGSKAKQLLENELLNEVLDRLDKDVFILWKSSQADEEIRNRLWYTYQGLQTFRETLIRYAADGRAAEKQLKEIHK